MKFLLFGIHGVSNSKTRHVNSFGRCTTNCMHDSLSVKKVILFEHIRSDVFVNQCQDCYMCGILGNGVAAICTCLAEGAYMANLESIRNVPLN